MEEYQMAAGAGCDTTIRSSYDDDDIANENTNAAKSLTKC